MEQSRRIETVERHTGFYDLPLLPMVVTHEFAGNGLIYNRLLQEEIHAGTCEKHAGRDQDAWQCSFGITDADKQGFHLIFVAGIQGHVTLYPLRNAKYKKMGQVYGSELEIDKRLDTG